MTKLLTKSEVCDRLSISQTTLQRIVADGDLRQLKLRGQCRYEETDVEAYIEKLRRESSRPVKFTAPKIKPGQRVCTYVPGMKVV